MNAAMGSDPVSEVLQDYKQSVVDGILAWLVQTSIATEDQLAPIRDGSYTEDLPPDFFWLKPKPLRTGLGDGSTWPLGLRLPRADQPYFSLFGISTKKLDRLHKADEGGATFETVAELRARRDKALADEHVPPESDLLEAREAVDGELNRLVDDPAVETLRDERVGFLMTLSDRIAVLLQNWEDAGLRDLLVRLERVTHKADWNYKRMHTLYRLASLTHDGQFLRGYKSGLRQNVHRSTDDVEEALARAIRNTQGVLVQLREPQERRDWSAGLEQGVRDGWPPAASN